MADKNNEHQVTFTISITKDGIAAEDLVAQVIFVLNNTKNDNPTDFWLSKIEQYNYRPMSYTMDDKETFSFSTNVIWSQFCSRITQHYANKDNIMTIISQFSRRGLPGYKTEIPLKDGTDKSWDEYPEETKTTIEGREIYFRIKNRIDSYRFIKDLFATLGAGKTTITMSCITTSRTAAVLQSLKTSPNVILHGAPGTGKTYTARHLAHAITGKPVGGDNEQYGFVQFHPSYDYTDFVEGLRPVNRGNNNIGFALRPGIFMEFVDKARRNPSKQYVFVIDEINRGDISKIFGELFFSIDPGYRGEKGEVTTQYANMHDTNVPESKQGEWNDDHTYNFFPKFYIPDNVYIIGTMNDIDRSVDTFDFAMRRRFRFIEITAEDSQAMLNDKPKADDAKTLMNDINNALDSYKLDSGYHIGASYFLDLADGQLTKEELWSDKLRPLIIEYLRGTGEKLDSNISLDDFLKDKQSTN